MTEKELSLEDAGRRLGARIVTLREAVGKTRHALYQELKRVDLLTSYTTLRRWEVDGVPSCAFAEASAVLNYLGEDVQVSLRFRRTRPDKAAA